MITPIKQQNLIIWKFLIGLRQKAQPHNFWPSICQDLQIILCYHLFAMNSTVIHGISAKYFFVWKWEFSPFPQNSIFEKENSFLWDQNSLKFSIMGKRILFFEDGILGKGEKFSLSYKKIFSWNTVYYSRIHRK